MKKPLPKPLFDTLEHLKPEPNSCIKEYLTNLNIVGIEKEYELAYYFLKAYQGSTDTFTAYRREVEKLLQWLWLHEKRLIKNTKREHIQDYIKFIQSPPLPWIGTKTVHRFISHADGKRSFNPDWRLFVVKQSKLKTKEGRTLERKSFVLSNNSIQSVFATLSSFFTFLMQEEYLEANPIALLRQKKQMLQRQHEHKVTRKLSNLQWKFVVDIAQEMALEDPSHFRALFALSCFFLLGLRISELAETPGRIPSMGHFSPDKNGLWWFTTIGKGNKVRDVAVPDELLDILRKYRLSRDLPALPARGEKTPLLHKLRGSQGLGTRQIRNLVQQCFDKAIDRLKAINKLDEASDLENATVHWLRHTAISADVSYRPREHVRDDAGHENAATTDKYIDIDRAARHQSAQQKRLNPFENNDK